MIKQTLIFFAVIYFYSLGPLIFRLEIAQYESFAPSTFVPKNRPLWFLSTIQFCWPSTCDFQDRPLSFLKTVQWTASTFMPKDHEINIFGINHTYSAQLYVKDRILCRDFASTVYCTGTKYSPGPYTYASYHFHKNIIFKVYSCYTFCVKIVWLLVTTINTI